MLLTIGNTGVFWDVRHTDRAIGADTTDGTHPLSLHEKRLPDVLTEEAIGETLHDRLYKTLACCPVLGSWVRLPEKWKLFR